MYQSFYTHGYFNSQYPLTYLATLWYPGYIKDLTKQEYNL